MLVMPRSAWQIGSSQLLPASVDDSERLKLKGHRPRIADPNVFGPSIAHRASSQNCAVHAHRCPLAAASVAGHDKMLQIRSRSLENDGQPAHRHTFCLPSISAQYLVASLTLQARPYIHAHTHSHQMTQCSHIILMI